MLTCTPKVGEPAPRTYLGSGSQHVTTKTNSPESSPYAKPITTCTSSLFNNTQIVHSSPTHTIHISDGFKTPGTRRRQRGRARVSLPRLSPFLWSNPVPHGWKCTPCAHGHGWLVAGYARSRRQSVRRAALRRWHPRPPTIRSEAWVAHTHRDPSTPPRHHRRPHGQRSNPTAINKSTDNANTLQNESYARVQTPEQNRVVTVSNITPHPAPNIPESLHGHRHLQEETPPSTAFNIYHFIKTDPT